MNARMIFVAVLGFFVLCSSTLSADLNEGLISHWQFDEGSGTTAYDSAGTNHGLIYEATWTIGQINSALSFDGVNDYVALPDNEPVWLPQYNFTLSAWVYFERAPGSQEVILDLNYAASAYPDYELGYIVLRNSTGELAFGMTTTTNPDDDLRTDDVLAKDNWYHVVAVRNGTTQAIYIDGQLNVSRTCSPDPIDFVGGYDDDRVNIGRYTTNRVNPCYHLKGNIDDVRIYNQALSAEEILQLYQFEPPNLIDLEITGPNEVAENFSTGYKAIAHYDDDSTRDVTGLVTWDVEPTMVASIEAGVLTTKDITNDESAAIWASYTEGDVTFDAEKAVMVFTVCPTGTALSFDGMDDYVGVPDDYSLDLGTHDLSFAFWFITNESSLEQMLGKRSTTTGPHNRVWDGYSAALLADGTVNVHFRHSASSDSAVFVTSTVSYNDGNWHHLAGVYTRSANLELYVDGVPEGTPGDISYAENKNIDLTQPLAIGCRVVHGRSNDLYFNGSIDEVRIYNRALSAEEIWAGMHTRLTGDEPGLVGYWDFDEGEGQIVYDLSGNGNDGQLGSTPDVDESDPAWIESDAPIGYCNPYLIATAAAKEALKHKRASLKELEAALAQEWTMYEALEQWFESGDFGDLSKGDIVKARQRTDSAMQHEELSKKALERSIEKLEDALAALGIEPPADEPGQE